MLFITRYFESVGQRITLLRIYYDVLNSMCPLLAVTECCSHPAAAVQSARRLLPPQRLMSNDKSARLNPDPLGQRNILSWGGAYCPGDVFFQVSLVNSQIFEFTAAF